MLLFSTHSPTHPGAVVLPNWCSGSNRTWCRMVVGAWGGICSPRNVELLSTLPSLNPSSHSCVWLFITLTRNAGAISPLPAHPRSDHRASRKYWSCPEGRALLAPQWLRKEHRLSGDNPAHWYTFSLACSQINHNLPSSVQSSSSQLVNKHFSFYLFGLWHVININSVDSTFIKTSLIHICTVSKWFVLLSFCTLK